jgi:hypothetical protein
MNTVSYYYWWFLMTLLIIYRYAQFLLFDALDYKCYSLSSVSDTLKSIRVRDPATCPTDLNWGALQRSSYSLSHMGVAQKSQKIIASHMRVLQVRSLLLSLVSEVSYFQDHSYQAYSPLNSYVRTTVVQQWPFLLRTFWASLKLSRPYAKFLSVANKSSIRLEIWLFWEHVKSKRRTTRSRTLKNASYLKRKVTLFRKMYLVTLSSSLVSSRGCHTRPLSSDSRMDAAVDL